MAHVVHLINVDAIEADSWPLLHHVPPALIRFEEALARLGYVPRPQIALAHLRHNPNHQPLTSQYLPPILAHSHARENLRGAEMPKDVEG